MCDVQQWWEVIKGVWLFKLGRSWLLRKNLWCGWWSSWMRVKVLPSLLNWGLQKIKQEPSTPSTWTIPLQDPTFQLIMSRVKSRGGRARWGEHTQSARDSGPLHIESRTLKITFLKTIFAETSGNDRGSARMASITVSDARWPTTGRGVLHSNDSHQSTRLEEFAKQERQEISSGKTHT